MKNVKHFDNFLNENVDPKSFEAEIDKVLKPLIENGRNTMFVPDSRSKATVEDILGIIISKFCRWEPDKILEITSSALRDSNANDLAKAVDKL